MLILNVLFGNESEPVASVIAVRGVLSLSRRGDLVGVDANSSVVIRLRPPGAGPLRVVLSHRVAGVDTGPGSRRHQRWHWVLATPPRGTSLDVAVDLELAVTVCVTHPVRAAVDTACCHAMP